ncbi:MAG: nucleotidyltransferase domain-containing protein [Candidatus Omnitrophica bacterium]|nr:nucleotidyltransferase domain-containing protein [Candidatus Omnitrophota bacterium]
MKLDYSVLQKAVKYSDLDLAIMTQTPPPLREMGELKEAFSESDLPIKVDLVDWATTAESFRAIIQQAFEVIQPAPAR